MPRSAKNSASKTPDKELAYNLEQAEIHLISAVELFGKVNKPVRDDIYVKRLTNAQESVTHLHRQELVRQRGPQRAPRSRKTA